MFLKPPVLLVLLCIVVTLSGCVEPGGNETDEKEDERPGSSAQNDVVLEDLKRCLWPKGDEVVECENRAGERDVRAPVDDAVCIAQYPGTDDTNGARLRWLPEQGNHTLHYWSESKTPVFGVIAVSSGQDTDYYNWNRGGATGEVVLPELPEQANVSVLVYRTWLQSGAPVPTNLTLRVDWDFVEGVDTIWPVRVLESDGDHYHLQPAMEIKDDEVFKRQWHDFMEVEGQDFHWVVGYKQLVRDDRQSDTRSEGC